MKKRIAFVLALALTLSLCACSMPGKQYTGLIEAIESGNLSQVQAELSALLPEFAREQESAQTYKKYAAIIDALEAKDSDGAMDAFYSQLQSIQEESYTYVDITNENWQEYFDLELAPHWQEDLFGDANAMWFTVLLTIKPAYRDRVMRNTYYSNFQECSEATTGDGSIALELAWHFEEYAIDIDYASRSYTWTERLPYGDYGDGLDQASVYYFSENNGSSAYVYYLGEPYVNYDGILVASRISDLELCRIQGKLPLKNG